jgi:hypothetical protein
METKNVVKLWREVSKIASAEKNDCFVYAISTAFDLPYDEAHKIATERFKREEKQGVSPRVILDELKEGTELNGRVVSKVIMSPTTVYKPYGQEVNRAARLSTFVKNNPAGTYIVLTRQHAVTLVDGVIHDTTSKTKDKAVVRLAYEINSK